MVLRIQHLNLLLRQIPLYTYWFYSISMSNPNMYEGIKAFKEPSLEEKIRLNNIILQRKLENRKHCISGIGDKYSLIVEREGTDFFIMTAVIGQKRHHHYYPKTKEIKVSYMPLLRFPLELVDIIGKTYMISFQRLDRTVNKEDLR